MKNKFEEEIIFATFFKDMLNVLYGHLVQNDIIVLSRQFNNEFGELNRQIENISND